MIAYIDAHCGAFGVESICRVLQFVPSTCWSAKRRPRSQRSVRDQELKAEIVRVHAENFGVYGAPKIWAQLNREGIRVACCAVERLMRELGLQGAVRGKVKRTTVTDDAADRPRDLVDRQFSAEAPNRLWVADLIYVRTWSGFVYVAFITDVFSRRIVGWQASRSLKTDLALHALEQAIWDRTRDGADLDGLVITPIAEFSTWRFATPNVSLPTASSPRSAHAAIPTTTRWPNRSLGSTRPSSFATRDPGAVTTSNLPPSTGSTGSTTAASSTNSAASHQQSSRTSTTVTTTQATRPQLKPPRLRETQGASTILVSAAASGRDAHRSGQSSPLAAFPKWSGRSPASSRDESSWRCVAVGEHGPVSAGVLGAVQGAVGFPRT